MPNHKKAAAAIFAACWLIHSAAFAQPVGRLSCQITQVQECRSDREMCVTRPPPSGNPQFFLDLNARTYADRWSDVRIRIHNVWQIAPISPSDPRMANYMIVLEGSSERVISLMVRDDAPRRSLWATMFDLDPGGRVTLSRLDCR